MRTTTDRWFRRLITRTNVPKGRLAWQAVIAVSRKISPLAVCRPFQTDPYHEATPRKNLPFAFFSGAITRRTTGGRGAAGAVLAGITAVLTFVAHIDP